VPRIREGAFILAVGDNQDLFGLELDDLIADRLNRVGIAYLTTGRDARLEPFTSGRDVPEHRLYELPVADLLVGDDQGTLARGRAGALGEEQLPASGPSVSGSCF
jgi:hypothetical protein